VQYYFNGSFVFILAHLQTHVAVGFGCVCENRRSFPQTKP